jgi:hypothetical protein
MERLPPSAVTTGALSTPGRLGLLLVLALPRGAILRLRGRARVDREMHLVVFRGVSEAGSIVEIRGQRGEDLEVRVDGAVSERIAGEKDFASTTPPLSFRLNSIEAHETFTASAEALEALADHVDDGKRAPLDYAAELLADGLIDVHFALTPRGRRALASR